MHKLDNKILQDLGYTLIRGVWSKKVEMPQIRSEIEKLQKGRPYKIYSLKIGFTEIVGQLEKQQRKMVDEMQGRIKRLKELGKL